MQREAFFLPAAVGQRFCLYYPARGCAERGAVVYLHPFAEEMNKSRRMASLQARALAASGYGVLQIDLYGCGDSSGDFGDATWQHWSEDVHLACHWLRARSRAPLILWGLRAGCLLAASAAVNLPEVPNFIFWQPVLSGKQHWQQFMRLKMAGELASGHTKGITEQLRQLLDAGQGVEIAGYTIHPALAGGFQDAELQAQAGQSGRVAWLELSTRADPILAPFTQKRIEQWQAAGYTVNAQVVRGPAFWQTTEIEDVPELLGATRAAMESWQ